MSAIVYLLQVSSCIAVFYLFYYFFLNRLTFFTINRYYLLITLVLSFIIPVIEIPVNHYTPVISHVTTISTFRYITTGAAIFQAKKTFVQPNTINWLQLLKIAYLLVAVSLFCRMAVMMVKFFARLKNKQLTRVGRIRIINKSKKLNNGSFLNYIFLDDESLEPNEIEQVIAHEMLHVKLLHSADRILVKIIQIILWFNPFAYLYARSIEENHEFEVDRELTRSTNKKAYAGLLLHLQIATNGSIYNNFSTIPLKKRIMMLFNKPSAKIKKMVYVLALPVLVLSCMAFASVKKDVSFFHNVYKIPEALKQIKLDGTSLNKVSINNIPTNVSPKVVPDDVVKENSVNDEMQTETDSTNHFSVIKGLDRLGPHPLVLIDSVEYPSDMLYKISHTCIRGIGIFLPAAANNKFGEKAKDGCVQIRTKGGIVYMLPYERENLAKEASVIKGKLFTRLQLTGSDGKSYDKLIVQLHTGGSATAEISHNGKVAFFIDSVFYNEDAIKNLSSEKIAAIHGEFGMQEFDSKKHPEINYHGYEAAFVLQTKDTKALNRKDLYYPWEKHLPEN